MLVCPSLAEGVLRERKSVVESMIQDGGIQTQYGPQDGNLESRVLSDDADRKLHREQRSIVSPLADFRSRLQVTKVSIDEICFIIE